MDYKRVVRRLLAVFCLSAVVFAAEGTPLNGQQGVAEQEGVAQEEAAREEAAREEAAREEAAREEALSPRNASYTIDVRLDHAQRTLTGRERIVWRNISGQPTNELQFHLYWNAWRDTNSTWLRERRLTGARAPRDDAFGSIDVTAIRLQPAGNDVTSAMRFIAPDDGNPQDRTVMTVPTGRIAPGASVTVDVEWTAKIPRPFARTGYVDDYYFIAQWFPKLGVLEDGGWNTHQFHSATEFYSDFGVYDVRITVPQAFIVGASGRRTERTDNPDGTATHRYRGDDIHDFAWTASPEYREVSQTFEHPTLPRTEMRLLLLPEHAGLAARYFASTAAALKYYGEWFGPYPYGYVTIVDPAFHSGADGMEYPTLFTGRSRWLSPGQVWVPEATTLHEAGHQFWYAIVASNEFEHAWMDEGLNTFATARAMDAAFPPFKLERRFFGGFIPWVIRDITLQRATDGNRLTGYRDAAEADAQSTPSFRYWPGTATVITYNKSALWLHTLERHLGWPVLQQIMATYFERWKFKHPRPDDFFTIANEVSGQDLTWFFDQVHRSSNAFDYGVQELISERVPGRLKAAPTGTYRTTVVVRRFGEATFPVDVVTTFADGHQIKERWDGVDRRAMYVYDRPSRATQTHVDPQRVLLLDVNYTNNSRALAPRTREAGLKWSLKWMVWMQDLMLTYGFFV
jgi:hypothetical protein